MRNSNVVRNKSIETSDFIDSATWEAVKRGGDEEIKRWINNQLDGTSVTVVLIGALTANRNWVKYEIDKSIERDNGLLGVYIHSCRDFQGYTDVKGENPFDKWGYNQPDGTFKPLSLYYHTYDWIANNGRENLGQWIDQAAKAAGR
ncbi:TIR domain-containing protein [Candidatus Gottesmanbacteria bacterium]|nr:TIR domain-containing protein [Candidatus Gottesmanbacteria bacterium]